jgi:amidase
MSGLTAELVVSHSLRDVAAVLDAVHGPAPGDPYVAPPPLRAYRDELTAEPQGLRIGLMTEPIGSGIAVEHEVVEATREAAELLGSLGHEVDTDIPMMPQGGPVDLIETFMTRWYAGQASTLDQFSMILGRPLTADDVEPLTWAMAEEGRRRHSGQYLNAVAIHQGIARMLEGWFAAGHDLLLTPTLGEVPPPLGSFDFDEGDPLEAFHRAETMGVFTAIFNATGNPAISLPLHWTSEGVPVGVQLAAPFGREDLLIAVGTQLEQARPWAERRPPVWAGAQSPA